MKISFLNPFELVYTRNENIIMYHHAHGTKEEKK